MITIREREGIKGDFSEQYAEIDELYQEDSEEEMIEYKKQVEELAKKIGLADEEDNSD